MDAINSLFKDAWDDIDKAGPSEGFEFSGEHFITQREGEEVQLLFNLALISLHHALPEAESIVTSDLRQISAEELTDVLAATEKALQIPAISLKALRQEKVRKITGIISAENTNPFDLLFKSRAKKVVLAGAGLRFTSFAIDTFVTALLAMGFTVSLLHLQFPELKVKAFSALTQEFYELLPIFSMFITFFIATFIFYPAAALWYSKRTFGMRVMRLKIASDSPNKLLNEQLLVRALCMPLSVISFSFLKILAEEPALHDRLSGTEIRQ